MKFGKIKLTNLHHFLILLVVFQLPLFDKVAESFSAYKEGQENLSGPRNFGDDSSLTGEDAGPQRGGAGEGGDTPKRPVARKPAARGPATRGPAPPRPVVRGPAPKAKASNPAANGGDFDFGMILKIVLGVGVVAYALNYYKSSGRKKYF